MAASSPVGAAYLDYAAATPLLPQAAEAMMPYLTQKFWNPSAPYALAREARAAVDDARTRLAHALGAKGDNLTLTAGATEANNLAFACVDGEVVGSAIEHESVLACVKARGGTVVGASRQGLVSADAVAAAITAQTELVSVALANGEVGSIQPVRQIGRAVAAERSRRLEAGERRPILLHTDASQAAGHVSVNVSSLGADLVTVSAAKVYGPKQVGLLWAADGVALRPLVLGGGQEGGVRSGTENVAGAVAFAVALEAAEAERAEQSRRLRGLRQELEQRLRAQFAWMWVEGPRQEKLRLPGLLHVSFPLIDARRLVILLERRGVSVGTGSACAASKMRVSHVLAALGMPQEAASGSLRMTLGRPTTVAEVAFAAEAICACVREEMARTGLGEAQLTEESARLRGVWEGR